MPAARWQPTVHILTRTSGRPRYFRRCRQSVEAQTYPHVRHLIATDDPASEAYLAGLPFLRVRRGVRVPGRIRVRGITYYHAPYNAYMNALARQVGDGLVLYLDDDDMLLAPDALERIVAEFHSTDDLVLWRVALAQRVVPSDALFGRPPRAGNVNTAGFAFHSNHLRAARWDVISACDARVVRRLYRRLRPRWLDAVLAGVQRTDEAGLGRRDDAEAPDRSRARALDEA